MKDKPKNQEDSLETQGSPDRRVRADAQRNIDALLEAALAVFTTTGVDAPVREIAEKAGVGIGTLYRHFPQRADLIAAVFRREIDACADAAPILAQEYEPFDALVHWMQRFTTFVATKHGLAKALHSGNPAFDPLPAYFNQRLRPAFSALLTSAVAAGAIRTDVNADDILGAISSLCTLADHDRPGHAQRMVALFADGLRYGANSSVDMPS